MLQIIITLFLCLCGIFVPLILFYLWQSKMDKKEIEEKIKAYEQYKKEMLREKFRLIGEIQKEKVEKQRKKQGKMK